MSFSSSPLLPHFFVFLSLSQPRPAAIKQRQRARARPACSPSLSLFVFLLFRRRRKKSTLKDTAVKRHFFTLSEENGRQQLQQSRCVLLLGRLHVAQEAPAEQRRAGAQTRRAPARGRGETVLYPQSTLRRNNCQRKGANARGRESFFFLSLGVSWSLSFTSPIRLSFHNSTLFHNSLHRLASPAGPWRPWRAARTSCRSSRSSPNLVFGEERAAKTKKKTQFCSFISRKSQRLSRSAREREEQERKKEPAVGGAASLAVARPISLALCRQHELVLTSALALLDVTMR